MTPSAGVIWKHDAFQNGDTFAVSLNAKEIKPAEIVYRMLAPSSGVAPYDYQFFWH
jgi:hypothetical protein